jgi:hypothetical protein
MASIVKANANLTAGGLAVLKRDFATTDRGQVTYTASYVCLSQFANTHAPKFQSGGAPPTPILPQLLLLNLTKTPTLIDLQSETVNGLTYFTATYSAGVETDYVVTTATDQRNITWIRDYQGAEENPIVASFDYMSISVTVEGTNREITIIPGSIGDIFNLRNITLEQINSTTPRIDGATLTRKTVQSTRQTRNQRGETTNSVTSTGIFEAQDAQQDAGWSLSSGGATGQSNTPTKATFSRNYDYQIGHQESYSHVVFS